MKLNLKFDTRLDVDDGIILIPSVQKMTNKLKDGGFLNVTGENGRQVKLKIGQSPNSNSYVSRKTLYSLHKQKALEVTLGCDPEFMLVNKHGKALRASEIITTMEGRIGNDGFLGELRPRPGANEIEVTENLRKLIRKIPSMMSSKRFGPEFAWPEAHSEKDNRAAGFHIHIGAPKPLTTKAALGSNKFLDSFAGALDYFVGIPGMLIEQSTLRRLGKGEKGIVYGNASDWRTSHFGTIEYRTLGGFHLRHPSYAKGVLALTQCVGKDILTYMESLSCGWAYLAPISGFETLQNKYGLPNRSDILNAFNSTGKDKALYMLEGIINVVSKMDNYHEHRDSIEDFLKLVINETIYSPKLSDNW
jgi:hypothetical protein